MNKTYLKYICFLFILVALFSCNKSEKRVVVVSIDNPDDSMISIINNGDDIAEFEMVLNDMDFSSTQDIVQHIENMPDLYADEPLEMKAARFVYMFTWKDSNISSSNQFYNPVLAINSIGGGLCGNRSAILTSILRKMGFSARSICLEGHVVSEVKVEGKWKAIDVDYGVCFRNQDGDYLSVNDLERNTEIFKDIEHYESFNGEEINLLNSFMLNNEELYSSTENNDEFIVKDYKKSDIINKLSLPPKSSFEFPVGNSSSGNFYTLAKLTITKDWTGEINIPFVIDRIEGIGRIRINSKSYSCSGELSNFVDFECLDSRIELIENSNGYEIYYFINPLVCKIKEENSIELTGDKVDNLEIGIHKSSLSMFYLN